MLVRVELIIRFTVIVLCMLGAIGFLGLVGKFIWEWTKAFL